jgi:hypothetical protein
MGSIDAALAAVRHALQAHDVLVIGTVVGHDIEHGQSAVRAGTHSPPGARLVASTVLPTIT